MAPKEWPESFGKPDGVEDVPLKKMETPEEREQKARDEEQKKQNEIDSASQNYYKNAKPVEPMPGGTTFSRESDRLAFVGIDAAEASFKEATASKNFGELPQADRDHIEKKYTDLAQWFDAKLQSIQQKFTGKPNAEAFQKELFDAQKQFEADLVKVSTEANGIINAPGAKKNATDAEQAKDEDAIQRKERLRFSKLMEEMLAQEKVLQAAERRNREAVEQKQWAKNATVDLEAVMGSPSKAA